MTRFPWQSIESAPRDGSAFVCLSFVTYIGGGYRPTDLVPYLRLLRRQHIASYTRDNVRSLMVNADTGLRATLALGEGPGGGFWRDAQREYSVYDGDVARSHWMTFQVFNEHINNLTLSWREIPEDVSLAALVRPTEPTTRFDFGLDILAAEFAWRVPGGWSAAAGRDISCHPDFLDGKNVNAAPFRYCSIEDFLPAAVRDPKAWV